MKKIVLLAGARPNFMKVAPLLSEFNQRTNCKTYLVHSGQHYDQAMSQEHFKVLGLPKPDLNLGVGSGSHAVQTAFVMERFEKALLKIKPSLVIVVGDVNSTLAGALTARKLGICTAHVEAGLRSHDWSMPEEVNRVVADSVSDFLFTHSHEANQNLIQEGFPRSKIIFVGNVMIDTLDRVLPKTNKIAPLSKVPYGLVTLHRPSNVDDPTKLRRIFQALRLISRDLPLYFPMHPRTHERVKNFVPQQLRERLHILPPLSYLEMLSAMKNARLAITDSGGIQEETTVLGVPCLTLRKTTERGVTVTEGTNIIIGENPSKLIPSVKRILRMQMPKSKRPKYWDGQASRRIVKFIIKHAL